jgi:hypothetical protein
LLKRAIKAARKPTLTIFLEARNEGRFLRAATDPIGSSVASFFQRNGDYRQIQEKPSTKMRLE